MAGSANSPVNVMDDDEELPCNNEGPPVNSQGRKLKSIVWQHMERKVLANGSIKASCKHYPRYKLERVEYCYEKLYGETYAKEIVSRIRITLMDLFDGYKGVSRGSASPNFATSSSIVPSNAAGGNIQMDDIMDYKMFLSKKRKGGSDKTEPELYFEEKNPEVTEKCNVLGYWNRSSIRYPNLACMARDILTIPISTVPSESAFSMEKKLINPWRASLGEKTIEVLACYEDWLRAKGFAFGPSSFFNHDNTSGEEEEEEDEAMNDDDTFE